MSSLWAYVSWCIEADGFPAVCRQFWGWVMVVCFCLAASAAILLIAAAVRAHRRRIAAEKAQAARDAVDHEAIEFIKWEG